MIKKINNILVQTIVINKYDINDFLEISRKVGAGFWVFVKPKTKITKNVPVWGCDYDYTIIRPMDPNDNIEDIDVDPTLCGAYVVPSEFGGSAYKYIVGPFWWWLHDDRSTIAPLITDIVPGGFVDPVYKEDINNILKKYWG